MSARWTIHVDTFGYVKFDFHAKPLSAGEVEFSPEGHFRASYIEAHEKAVLAGKAGHMSGLRLKNEDISYREARAALAEAGW